MSAKRPRALALSARELLILNLLVRDEAQYGLQLVAAAPRRLKRGTVYVTLGRMEAKGYITSRLDEDAPALGGLRRRRYTPTALGRELLNLCARSSAVLAPRLAR